MEFQYSKKQQQQKDIPTLCYPHNQFGCIK